MLKTNWSAERFWGTLLALGAVQGGEVERGGSGVRVVLWIEGC